MYIWKQIYKLFLDKRKCGNHTRTANLQMKSAVTSGRGKREGGPQGSTVCQVHFECFSSLRGSAANPSVVAGWRVHSSVLLANPIGRYMLVCSDYFIILKMNKNKYRTSTWFSNSS